MKIQMNSVIELKEYKFNDFEPIIVNSIDEAKGVEFCKKFQELENRFEYIPIVIDSYGGNCHALLGMAEMILASKKTVITYLRGKAMSAGAILTCLGTEGYRYMGPNSYMMMHQVSNFVFGNTADIRQNAKHTEDIEKHILSLVEKNIGKPKGFLLRKIKELAENSDWYIDSKQAKQYNLVNHIGQPKIDISLKTQYKITKE